MKLPACTHRPTCPGCPRYGERGVAAPCVETLTALAERTGAGLDRVVEGAALGFRVRARLAVRGRASSPKLGIFQEGSHHLADIPSCNIHHPRINAAARSIREAIRRTGTPPYIERAHGGLLRYVQIVVERSSGRVQVVLVANDRTEHSLMPMAAVLQDLLGERLQGLWWNGNPERSNTIFGPDWHLLAGAEAVEETIGGAQVFFPPGAFGQSNLDLADRIVEDIHSRVPDDAVVAELYCGVGAIGLGLVERSREVRFNEVSAQGLRGLEIGLAALPPPLRAKATVTGTEATAALDVLCGATCVIVDPPRRGLDDAVPVRLCEQRPEQLLYVSCDAESLVRDAKRLVERGSMRLKRLTPYALFPYTAHVETLAEFG